MTLEVATEIVSAIAFVIFVGLLGASMLRMTQRVWLYFHTGRKPSIILRRDIALLGSLLLVFGALAAVRFFGLNQFSEGWPRFWFIVFTDVVALTGLGYWTWAEYRVIGVEGKEDE